MWRDTVTAYRPALLQIMYSSYTNNCFEGQNFRSSSSSQRRRRRAYGTLRYRKTSCTFWTESYRILSAMLPASRGGLLLVWFTWPLAIITMIVAHCKRIWVRKYSSDLDVLLLLLYEELSPDCSFSCPPLSLNCSIWAPCTQMQRISSTPLRQAPTPREWTLAWLCRHWHWHAKSEAKRTP